MEIIKLSNEDKALTRPLYEEVFAEDSSAFVDYYYSEKTRDNTIYAVKEDGAVRAMLHLNPYTLLVNGKEEQAHYIVAVATEKKYRKRGFMKALLQTALQDMYRSGEPFTYLMPAAEAIYLPHGFATVLEQEQRYVCEKDVSSCGGRKAAAEDAGRMAEAAGKALAGRYQVYARRDEAYYRRLMKEYESDGGCLLIWEQDGAITDCRPCVDEIPREKAKIMARAANVRRLLLLLGLRYLTAVCFRVTDPLIPENNQVFLVTGTEYSGVMLMEGLPQNSEGTLPVQALTKFIFGAVTPEELAREEGVEMTDRMKQELKKIIPLSSVYLNEIV